MAQLTITSLITRVRRFRRTTVHSDLVVFSSEWGDYHSGHGWALHIGGEPVWSDEWGVTPFTPQEIEWVNRTHSSVTPAMRRLIELGAIRRQVLYLTHGFGLPRGQVLATREATQAAMDAAWGDLIAPFREEQERRQRAAVAVGRARVEAMPSPPPAAELQAQLREELCKL